MISSQQLGERLADARKRAKLTQAQVAERLGFARTTLVAIEKGERRPSNAELVALSEVLAVTLHDLLGAGHARAELSKPEAPRPVHTATSVGFTERYVSLAVSAYDQELLSEGELAECLATDVTTARAVYQERQRILLEDGTHLSVDFSGADLRSA